MLHIMAYSQPEKLPNGQLSSYIPNADHLYVFLCPSSNGAEVNCNQPNPLFYACLLNFRVGITAQKISFSSSITLRLETHCCTPFFFLSFCFLPWWRWGHLPSWPTRLVGLDVSFCKEMGMILDPKQLIPAPHALTGLSRRLRSLRTEAESKVQEWEIDATGRSDLHPDYYSYYYYSYYYWLIKKIES